MAERSGRPSQQCVYCGVGSGSEGGESWSFGRGLRCGIRGGWGVLGEGVGELGAGHCGGS